VKERTSARSGPRLPITLQGTLIVGSGDEARILQVVTCDVATGGASIDVPEPLVVGASVTLQLVLPGTRGGDARRVALPGLVTRIEEDNPCRCAVSFTAVRPSEIETLKSFIFRARDDRRR
jgi:PilZ domain-containing protein